MPAPLPSHFRDISRPRINRAPSPPLAVSAPWLLVMLGSMVPTWPVIASAPVLPPLGFMILIAWQQMRPGLLPIWAGLPLGFFDDLFSGQPLGSSVVLWSLAMIALDVIEQRIPWRNFVHNWVAAAGAIAVYLVFSLALANINGGQTPPEIILPQVGLSVLIFPIVARLVAGVDRLRLLPIRAV